MAVKTERERERENRQQWLIQASKYVPYAAAVNLHSETKVQPPVHENKKKK